MISSISTARRCMQSALSVGLAVIVLSSCTAPSNNQPKTERYISPQIEGVESRINLEEVEKAFFATKGNDLSSWMGNFEKRVNEIYEGPEIVSIDASKQTGKLNVTGFIEKNKEPGYQTSEDKLFSLEQTGDVVNNQMPYKISDQHGNSYNQGHYSLFDNAFIQALVIGNLLSGAFGPRYYTPYANTTVLRDHRNNFRTTPGFNSQKSANQQFNTRFKQRATGTGIGSSSRFSRPSTGSGTSTGRSWSNPSGRSYTNPWSGRRSSSPFGGGRGWGGRRR